MRYSMSLGKDILTPWIVEVEAESVQAVYGKGLNVRSAFS